MLCALSFFSTATASPTLSDILPHTNERPAAACFHARMMKVGIVEALADDLGAWRENISAAKRR